MVQVSLSTSTNYSGERNALVEELGTALTVSFSLDEPAPSGGLKVYVDSDVEQIVNRLDLPGFGGNPIAENINPSLVGTNFDNSGFFLTIDEGATEASFTIDVFDNSEPDTFLPETFDGLVEAVFQLKTQDQVDSQDLGDVGNLSDYTIDSNAATSSVLFADEESQLTEQSEPPTPTPTPEPSDGVIKASLFAGPNYIIKDEKTVGAVAILLTDGVISKDGFVVSVDAPNLSEFDLAGISVEGGTIAAVRDGGFDVLMTEYTALVNLPIADNGDTVAGETASFSLAADEGYEIVEDYSSGSFNLVDTREDIPRGEVTEPNNIIPLAIDTEITPENPSFSGSDAIYFNIGNRYLNEDGTFDYIDYSEDVDVYEVKLSAGDTIAIETFEGEGNPAGLGNGLELTLNVFDPEGNRLLDYQTVTLGAAPDKLFGGTDPFDENETDSYTEFTAYKDGTYYVTLGTWNNVQNFQFNTEVTPPPLYDPFVPSSGNGNAWIYGNYDIEIDLLTEDNPRKTGTPTPSVSNPSITDPPTLSLSANPTTIDSEGNFINAVVEHVELDGTSSVTFTIEAEGEIPEDGVEIVLNSNANLFEYVSFIGQNKLPRTIGGQSLGAFYNEDGIPTGIRLLIEEPTMTVNYETANPDSSELQFYGTIYDEFEPLETDGAEDVTFFLLPGEGYEIAPDAGETEVTYYDSVEDVPAFTGGGDTIPEVGVTVSETKLVETEGTETTITFTLSEPPPPGGVIVFLDSEADPVVGSVLSQFDVLGAEISGGTFPVPNDDRSGFFFTVTEQTATITLPVFNELAVDSLFPPDSFLEGILALDFALQPQAGYTIDPDASGFNITIADNPESQIQLSLAGSTQDDEESTILIESEGTVGVHTFSLGAPPPVEGLTVSVSTPDLSDFDVEAIEVIGGTIAGVRENGFDLTIIEQTATVSLPVLEDGANEGTEIATFTLEPGEGYELNPVATEATFTLADTLDQVSVPEESEDNNTIPEANALGLSADTPSVSLSGLIANIFVDPTEDVDFYSFNLEAGQRVSLDVDSSEWTPVYVGLNPLPPAIADTPQQVDTELRLFDAQGNELSVNSDGAAPGEEFSRDPYLEYSASEAGTYYVGVSMLGNRNYDPNVARSGSGWVFPEAGVFFGPYELTASLIDDTTEPEQPTTEPVFGSLEGDIIEVSGTSQLIFGGDSDDLIDASIGSEGSNRIYAGSGDDTLILGMSDRIVGGEGNDKFFAMSGGDNILTGGAGADQFWIATAETPNAANIITDFTSGEDVLGIAGLGIGFGDLSITQQENNILIAANGSDLAILQGIGADSLVVDNFAFG